MRVIEKFIEAGIAVVIKRAVAIGDNDMMAGETRTRLQPKCFSRRSAAVFEKRISQDVAGTAGENTRSGRPHLKTGSRFTCPWTRYITVIPSRFGMMSGGAKLQIFAPNPCGIGGGRLVQWERALIATSVQTAVQTDSAMPQTLPASEMRPSDLRMSMITPPLSRMQPKINIAKPMGWPVVRRSSPVIMPSFDERDEGSARNSPP